MASFLQAVQGSSSSCLWPSCGLRLSYQYWVTISMLTTLVYSLGWCEHFSQLDRWYGSFRQCRSQFSKRTPYGVMFSPVLCDGHREFSFNIIPGSGESVEETHLAAGFIQRYNFASRHHSVWKILLHWSACWPRLFHLREQDLPHRLYFEECYVIFNILAAFHHITFSNVKPAAHPMDAGLAALSQGWYVFLIIRNPVPYGDLLIQFQHFDGWNTTPWNIGDVQQTIESTEIHKAWSRCLLPGSSSTWPFSSLLRMISARCFDIAFNKCFEYNGIS